MSRTAEAQQAGLTEEKLAKVEHFDESDLTSREKVALRYVEFLVLNPHGADDAFFAEMKRWFTEGEITEIAYTVLAFNGAQRFLASIGQEPVGAKHSPETYLVA